MLIDSHCHLDFPQLQEDFEGVLQRSKLAGVEKLLTISTKISKTEEILRIAESHSDIYCTIGIHPHHVALSEEAYDKDKMLEYTKHPKVIGVGETGLDYYYDTAPREIQKKVFEQHLDLCLEKDLPVIVHTREAEEDTWEILERYSRKGNLKGIMHCFSSQNWLAEKAIEIGFMVSFSGIVTFKKSIELQELAARVPLEHILVETDAPYLAPVPMRGKSNEPSFVKYTAEFIANLRGERFEEFAMATSENFQRLFCL